MSTRPSKQMETFPNPHEDTGYTVVHMTDEFTCVCPKTGQPDYASLEITIVPRKLCVELKSLKLYLWTFRNEGHFHEDVTNCIMKDLRDLLDPVLVKVHAKFFVRGGIHSDVVAEHRRG